MPGPTFAPAIIRQPLMAPLLLAFMLGLLSTSPAAMAEDAGDHAPRSVWHTDIDAAYERLAASTQTLRQSAESFCEGPTAEGLTQLKQGWKDAFLDWQRVRFVDFGPIAQESRAWQFQFWPDSKNLVGRKADYWLTGDRSATPTTLAEGSIALQGFPALEYLLFDAGLAESGIQPGDPRACALTTAIAGHLSQLAQTVAHDWTAFQPHYEATDSYTDTTVRAAMNALEILVDKRLAEPMGLSGSGRRNPYAADAWRSGESIATLQASLEGLESRFLPGLNQLLSRQGKQELIEPLQAQFDSTQAKLNALQDSLGSLLKADEGYRALQSLYIEMTELKQLLNGRVAVALGVVRGFNSSDGD